MDPFTTETWVAILQELSSKEWSVLSLTCKFFHAIAQPQLYREVSFLDLRSWDNKEKVNWMAAYFGRSVTNKPVLATLVRSFTYEFWGASPAPIQNNPALRHLPSFINLRELSIDQCHIDTCFSSTLRSLPHLESVLFKQCTVVPVVQKLQKPLITNTLYVDISSPLSLNGWSSAVPGHLQGLTILGVEHPSITMMGVLSELMQGRRTKTLTEFNIHAFVPSNIHLFLEASPNIRSISIPAYNPSMGVFRSLPRNCMPRLQHYSGPPEFCRVFVQGRPVHSATLLVSDNTPHDTLLSLERSTVLIVNLMLVFEQNISNSLRQRKVSLGTFLIYAPITLERLAWNYTEESYLISCLPLLRRLVNLRALQGKVAFCASEKLTVDACFEARPSLREVTFVGAGRVCHDSKFFVGGLCHNIKWVRSDNGKWVEYAPRPQDRHPSRIYSFDL